MSTSSSQIEKIQSESPICTNCGRSPVKYIDMVCSACIDVFTLAFPVEMVVNYIFSNAAFSNQLHINSDLDCVIKGNGCAAILGCIEYRIENVYRGKKKSKLREELEDYVNNLYDDITNSESSIPKDMNAIIRLIYTRQGLEHDAIDDPYIYSGVRP